MKKKFKYLKEFKLIYYDFFKEASVKINAKLKKEAILVINNSEIYENAEDCKDCGSIWYNCTIDELQHFHDETNQISTF